MPRPMALVACAALLLGGCARYEFLHELRLEADGSGEIVVRGRPELWRVFKGVSGGSDEELERAARTLLASAGLDVRSVRVRRLGLRPELIARAAFGDLGLIDGAPAFPDLRVSLAVDGRRLRLAGRWRAGRQSAARAGAGEVAVRVRSAGRIYSHADAADGVERGNILTWREPLSRAFAGEPIVFEAELGRESVLRETLSLFLAAIAAAMLLLGAAVAVAVRHGRSERRRTERGVDAG